MIEKSGGDSTVRFSDVTEIITVTGILSAKPSLTINCAIYWPERSAVKVGEDMPVSVNEARLPAGFSIKPQL